MLVRGNSCGIARSLTSIATGGSKLLGKNLDPAKLGPLRPPFWSRTRPLTTVSAQPYRRKDNHNHNHSHSHSHSHNKNSTYAFKGTGLVGALALVALPLTTIANDSGSTAPTHFRLHTFSKDNPDHAFSPAVFPKDPEVLYKSLDQPPADAAVAHDDQDTPPSSRSQNRKLALHRQSALYRLVTLGHSIRHWVSNAYEMIITCFRFVQLSTLFIPVIVTLPVVFIGPKVAIPVTTVAEAEPVGQPNQSGSSVKDAGSKFSRMERKGALLWYKYLTWTMETAGPSFIKLGQWAASRTDIFPDALCTELSKLHSHAKAHSLRQTRHTISKAFDRPFDDIFDEFIEMPLGVGAMGQVYRAKLAPEMVKEARERVSLEQQALSEEHQDVSKTTFKNLRRILGLKQKNLNDLHTNEPWVVIKVLHPSVRRVVERDLSIMHFFANLINWVPTMEWLSLPGEVDQFARMMRAQMDLRIEAENLLTFRANFDSRNDPISFPLPYTEFCTRNVLVEEDIAAIPMGRLLRSCRDRSTPIAVAATEESQVTPLFKDIANKGLNAFLKMLLLDNFLHSDLHPGNIFVRLYRKRKDSLAPAIPEFLEDSFYTYLDSLSDYDFFNEINRLYDEEGYRPQVCFIDAGLVTSLNKVNRRNFLDLFKAIATFDGYHVGELMIERSRTPETAIDPEVFALRTQQLVQHIKERTFALGSVKLGDLLGRMLGMVRSHHVRMEGDFITVVLSILLLEGIGRQLDPDIDLFKSSIPILRQLSQQGGELPLDSDSMSMFKVWIALEIRQFISASIQDVHRQVKYDGLCPNH